MALIYFVVFTFIFQARSVGYQPYVLFIVIGVLAWQWFSQCATETSRALLSEARLVRSTNLPRELWVVRIVVAKGIEFLLSLPVMAGFAIFFIVVGETKLHYRILLLPLAIVLQFLLSVGLGLILAPVTVLFTDMPRIVRIALRMGFYATPIIYGESMRAPEPPGTSCCSTRWPASSRCIRAGFFPEELNVASIASRRHHRSSRLVAGTIVFKRLEAPVLKEI